MALSITRLNRTLISPHESIPSTILELSFIDKIPVLRCYARTLHVFRQGPEAVSVIREALSKALVPYYPLAGRLKELNQREVQIDCTGEKGVWFIEATASCTLESVDYLEKVLEIPYGDLLPDQVPVSEGAEPLVQMQVTQFVCGGFVMGLRFCHTVCDGLGAAQFLNAVGELARGQTHLSVSPVWHRDFIPSPPPNNIQKVAVLPSPPPLPPAFPGCKLEHANVDIPSDQINRLKREFQESTGQTCSTFEIIAASFWKHRTEAIALKENTVVRLVFFANCRHLLNPPLPGGFYGNCFFPVTVSAAADSIAREMSTFEVVKLIKGAKARLPEEFGKYVDGSCYGGDNPFAPPLGYTTLFVSEWGKLGFNNVDYGWGPPVHVVPIQGSSVVPAGIMGSMPLPKNGVRLMTWCVEEAHRQSFLDLMKN